MKHSRPAIVLVFAILHLVIGGLGLFMDICGGITQAAGGAGAFTGGNNPQQAELQQTIQRTLIDKVPGYYAYTYGLLAVSFFLSVLLLVAGIGLLAMKRWAWILSLVYAFISLLQKIFSAIYMFLFILPAYESLFQNLPNDNSRAFMVTILKFAQAMGVVMIFVTMIYPVAVLIAMLTPTVRKAMKSGPRDDRNEANEQDQGEGVEDYRD